MFGETISPHNEKPEVNLTENRDSVRETPEGQISHEEFAEKLTELNQMEEPMRAKRISDVMRWRIEEQEGKPADIERELYYPDWSSRNLEALVIQHTAVHEAQKNEKSDSIV